jgi:hypothetical protein
MKKISDEQIQIILQTVLTRTNISWTEGEQLKKLLLELPKIELPKIELPKVELPETKDETGK